MHGVKRYLHNKPLELALNQLLEELAGADYFNKPHEMVNLEQALGTVTAEPIFAKNSAPHYCAAAMDGYAVKVEETFGASETNPIELTIGSQAQVVDTGDPIPAQFNGVIMVEDVQPTANNKIEIIKPAYPWQHIRQIGEDIVASELILPPYHTITPFDLGGLAAAGIQQVPVVRKPKVAIIPTGTELVPIGSELQTGDIVEYNTLVLGGLIIQWGGQVERLPIVADDYQRIKQVVLTALETFDLVIINAGSSAGREDYTAAIVAEIGELLTHGVAIKPGKPTILGMCQNKPIIGIPGYPVSAALVCQLFVKPIIARWYHQPVDSGNLISAILAKKVNSGLGSDDFVRVKLGKVNEKIIAAPISKGAGVITSLMEADGILTVPVNREGYQQGSEVDITLLVDKAKIDRQVVVSGSHDMSIDILDYWLSKVGGFRLAATNVGSLGGMMALAKGEAECAGVHLLDPVTGEYNIPDIKRYLKGVSIKLVNVAYRQQGLIVPKGNPQNIQDLNDVVAKSVSYINRQKGSGTRVLLDYLLKKYEMDATEIKGYEREEFTHLAVSAAVNNGTAHVGLGILAAAQAFDLDFIPIGEERFDLCILTTSWNKKPIQKMLKILNDQRFQEEIEMLGGYDIRDCGKLLWEG